MGGFFFLCWVLVEGCDRVGGGVWGRWYGGVLD